MNYYEELGIRSDADEEEIRKAHRRLVKLMHPDQHRDQGLKQLAETQMRRLNSIVAVLLDPDERAEYDEQLRTGNLGGDMANPAQQQRSWRSVPWWIASTLGTIVLTVGTIWLVADRYGPGNVTHRQPPQPIDPPIVDTGNSGSVSTPPNGGDGGKDTVQVPVTTDTKPPIVVDTPKQALPPEPPKAEVKNTELPKIEVKNQAPPKIDEKKVAPPPDLADAHRLPPIPPVNRDHQSPQKAQNLPATPPQTKNLANNSKPTVLIPPGKLPQPPARVEQVKNTQTESVKRQFKDNLPTPTLVSGTRDTSIGIAAPLIGGASLVGGPDVPRSLGNVPSPPARHPLVGEWVYAPSTPQQKKAGFFPPEFIHLMLIKDTTGGIRGEYSARYNVDRSVSPDVSFSLRATDQSAMKYVWTAANGAHGTLTIDTVEADVMRIEWRDTSKAHGDRLTSGVATLVRKN